MNNLRKELLNIENLVENKYSLLLGCQTLLIVLSPFFESNLANFLIDIIFFVIVIIVLKILHARKGFFVIFLVLVLSTLLSEYLAVFVVNHSARVHAGILSVCSYTLCVGVIIVFMIRRVFSERSVTADTIKGCVSIYILIGIWWGLVYYLLFLTDPGSFTFSGREPSLSSLLYYSFTTLTTLGYGDIIPKSSFAMSSSTLEAVAGQVYLTVFVARLVGLHIATAKPKE